MRAVPWLASLCRALNTGFILQGPSYRVFTLQGSSHTWADSLFRTNHKLISLVKTRHHTLSLFRANNTVVLLYGAHRTYGLALQDYHAKDTFCTAHHAALVTQFVPCLIMQFHSATIIAHAVSLCRAHKVPRLKMCWTKSVPPHIL